MTYKYIWFWQSIEFCRDWTKSGKLKKETKPQNEAELFREDVPFTLEVCAVDELPFPFLRQF